MSLVKKIYQVLPASIRDTFLLRFFGFTKVPLIFWVRPVIKELSDKRCIIKIPLIRRTKNHLGSMYFGALAIGADCAGGFAAMKIILESSEKASLVFKDLHADFLKRPESDTYFTCEQVPEIKEFAEKVFSSNERQDMPLKIVATCPDKFGNDPVATFTLTLSLKKKRDQ